MPEALRERVRSISDVELKENLTLGRAAFQEGVFEIYVEEAKNRNISLEEVDLVKYKEEKAASSTLNIVKFGYALGALGGIGGYIVALVLAFRKNRNSKEKFYSLENRKKAKWIAIFTTGMIIVGWPAIWLALSLLFRMLVQVTGT